MRAEQRLVACKACGWLHVPISRAVARAQVSEVKKYLNTLPPDERAAYSRGRGVSVDDYEKCFRCGGSYREFREAQPDEIPLGVTVQVVIDYYALTDDEDSEYET